MKARILSLVVLLSALTIFPIKFCYSQVQIHDSLALVDLYNNSVGENWTNSSNWLDGPVETWFGITVESGRVTGINLNGNHLLGFLPPSLENLNSLSALDLAFNQLTGNFPVGLTNLVNLDSLNLSHNQFTGLIPQAIGNLVNIIKLNLSFNQLSGLIPASVGTLDKLKVLDLSNNFFYGKFPVRSNEELPGDTLNIGDNKFNFDDLINLSGYQSILYSPQAEIPLNYRDNTLFALAGGANGTNRYTWLKQGNQVASIYSDSTFVEEGTAYYSVQVTNENLPALVLISGSFQVISPLFTNDSLALVNLYNSTNGAGWKQPWNLSGPHWNWTGVSTKAGRVSKLQLSNLDLSGTLPASMPLGKVTLLDLDNNKLAGDLPSWLGDFKDCKFLDLSHNNFDGAIPLALGKAVSLNHLDLSGNHLSGPIPAELAQIPLSDLNLSDNLLTGGLPLFNSNTKFLLLNNNQLSGQVPVNFQSNTSLQEISLHHNQFSGEIPDYFGTFTKLRAIDLSFNSFTGSIPWSIGYLKDLFLLNLQNNHFSGYIPLSLYSRKVYLPPNISNNDFTFDGMEEFATHYSLGSYEPQATIPLNHQNGLLSVSAGGNLFNNTYEWYRNDQLIETKLADSTIQISEEGNYHVVVSNLFAHELKLSSYAIHLPGYLSMCPGANSRTIFNDSLLAATHQWQVNTGNGFTDITDGTNYSGSHTGNLSISNIQPTWNGYIYRCRVNGTEGGEYTVRFVNKWTGAKNSNWEDAGNWECQQVPGENSTVIINQGIVNLNSNVMVYSLSIAPGAVFNAKPGSVITIRH